MSVCVICYAVRRTWLSIATWTYFLFSHYHDNMEVQASVCELVQENHRLVRQRGGEAGCSGLTGKDILSGNQEAQWGAVGTAAVSSLELDEQQQPSTRNAQYNTQMTISHAVRKRRAGQRLWKSEMCPCCELVTPTVITSWEEIGHLALSWPSSSPLMSSPVTLLLCLSWPFTDSAWGWSLIGMTFSYNISCHGGNYSYTLYLLCRGLFDLLPFWLITIRLSRYYIMRRKRERGDRRGDGESAGEGHWHSFTSSAFCRNKHSRCNAPAIPPLPFLLNVASLSLPAFMSSPSHLVLSLSVPLSLSLPRCFWQIQFIPSAFQPLQWLHGLATQLGAHYLLIHRLEEDRQRQPFFFSSSAPSPSIILSLSLPGRFLSKRVLFLFLLFPTPPITPSAPAHLLHGA